MSSTLLAILSLSFTNVCVAHMRLVHPVPRDSNSGIKGPYPCGTALFWEDGQAVTTLSPGLNELRFEETVNHAGAPFRIALSYNDDSQYDNLIIVDHLPHNDAGGGTFSSAKPYTITVDIPDIDCPKCSLQIINPMTDKLGNTPCCEYPKVTQGGVLCSSVYHSCANIVITGSVPVAEYKHTASSPSGPYGRECAAWKAEADTFSFNVNSISYDSSICQVGKVPTCSASSTPSISPFEDTDSAKKVAAGEPLSGVCVLADGELKCDPNNEAPNDDVDEGGSDSNKDNNSQSAAASAGPLFLLIGLFSSLVAIVVIL